MTKAQKIRTLLSLTYTTADGVMDALLQNPQFNALIGSKPGFSDEVKELYANMVAPVFMGATDEMLDAAIGYFSSDIGKSFQKFQAEIGVRLGVMSQKWAVEVERRLRELADKKL
jgi:hypothetical protein